MAGHSKWANTKHRKAKVDEARSKVFGRLIREITVAAKSNNDPSSNSHLRLVILKAKSVSVPNKNIEAAINKGSSEKDTTTYLSLTYEGYAPHNVPIIVEALTDNKTRTVSNIRYIFNKNGGSMGETGSVAWMFRTIGNIVLSKKIISEENLLNLILESGADDLLVHDEFFEIITTQQAFHPVLEAIQTENLHAEYAEIIRQPHDTCCSLSEEETKKIHKLIQSLEDNEDVQNVYSNLS